MNPIEQTPQKCPRCGRDLWPSGVGKDLACICGLRLDEPEETEHDTN